ncbi:MAG: hypothetical protein C9356_02035 [Oleiphilus sp.]|nr:MAG: hypothetical protein C9356_02035 [Oleiphilus sp.]
MIDKMTPPPRVDTTTNKPALMLSLLLVFLALAIRLLFLEKEPYWIDETYTTWFAGLSFADLLFWAPTFESHPPFYYLLVKIWNETLGQFFSHSERYLSLALSVGLLVTAFKLLKQLSQGSPQRASLILLAVLFGFSPIMSWYAIEARPYILFALTFSLAMYGFFLVIMSPQEGLKPWFVLSIGVLLTNWSHSTGPLHSLVIYIALMQHFLVTRDTAFLRRMLGSASLVFVLSLPLLYMLFQQVRNWASSSWIPEPTWHSFYRELLFLYVPEHALGPLLLKLTGSTFISEIMARVFSVLVPVLFIYGMYMATRKRSSHVAYLVLFTFFAPIISFAVSIAGPNILLGRTLIPAMVPYFILATLSIAQLPGTVLKWIILAMVLMSLLYGSYAELRYRDKEPWDQVYRHLEANTQEEDLVLLLPNSIRLPLAKAGDLGKLKAEVRSMLDEFPALGKSTFYPVGTPSVPGFRQEDTPRLENLLATHNDRVLLVTRLEPLFDPNSLVPGVFSGAGYLLVGTSRFDNLKVHEYIPETE